MDARGQPPGERDFETQKPKKFTKVGVTVSPAPLKACSRT